MEKELILSSAAEIMSKKTVKLKDILYDYDRFFSEKGRFISESVDRSKTPWLKMFDLDGNRVDKVMMPYGYFDLLYDGYKRGMVWRIFEERSLLPFFALGYVCSYYDPGLYCPYTVSVSTAVPLYKYGSEDVKKRFLPELLKKDMPWQGATWMTEIKGGSDLGNAVETVAVHDKGDKWLITGDKYFASNAISELAVAAARPEDAPEGVKGLALYLIPKYREDGKINFTIRRIKDKWATRLVPTGEIELRDSEAYLLGEQRFGIYLILELLNISRVANSIGSVAHMHKIINETGKFAARRIAFGRPIIEHPMIARQIKEWQQNFKECFSLAWYAVEFINEVWLEKPRYSDHYHLFRLVAHLAKYWTAEQAVQSAKWAMEVFAGLGILEEFAVERWFREAIILSIWEGTPHRQILDGMEVIKKKAVHKRLIHQLSEYGNKDQLMAIEKEVDKILELDQEEMEQKTLDIFPELARACAKALVTKI